MRNSQDKQTLQRETAVTKQNLGCETVGTKNFSRHSDMILSFFPDQLTTLKCFIPADSRPKHCSVQGVFHQKKNCFPLHTSSHAALY